MILRKLCNYSYVNLIELKPNYALHTCRLCWIGENCLFSMPEYLKWNFHRTQALNSLRSHLVAHRWDEVSWGKVDFGTPIKCGNSRTATQICHSAYLLSIITANFRWKFVSISFCSLPTPNITFGSKTNNISGLFSFHFEREGTLALAR